MTDPLTDISQAIEHIRAARYAANDAAHALPAGVRRSSTVQLVDQLENAEVWAERVSFYLHSVSFYLHCDLRK